MQVKELIIPIVGDVGLHIYSSTTDELYVVEDAADCGESQWQLVEGNEYDFEILDGQEDCPHWTILPRGLVFIVNKKYPNRGKIRTGISVGTVTFTVANEAAGIAMDLDLEICSSKIDYRSHYQTMLTEIADYYTDLVMQQGSTISQKFEVDYDASIETLYQKFAFIKGIVSSDQFDAAVHKVIVNPVRKWTETYEEKRIESVRRLTRSSMRQIATRSNRLDSPDLPAGLKSLPRTLSVRQKVDTVDTHENQFVKYVLLSFYGFCSSLSDKEHASEQLKAEVTSVCKKIAEYLNNNFFKQISQPTRLNIGSPILQRKEGYREILQAWLMFDLAAKITWDGGNAVYAAGKKNIATLYEYWLFFKLMHVVSEVFDISAKSKELLVQQDPDKISLSIRQGRMTVVDGSWDDGNRLLNVRLYYNRTFRFQDDGNVAGSWTMSMRPDYTLSIWPGRISEQDAEKENTIVHIHFDAKYRLDKILLEDAGVNKDNIDDYLDNEKEDNEINVYKRGDLLKMHAYKDAIRRTVGAYVLYPGDKTQKMSGFHEVVPGLGAFCMTPGDGNTEQIDSLKKFILDVVDHLRNRVSKREKLAIYSKTIYEAEPSFFYEAFPEHIGYGMFPDSTLVLVGSYKRDEQRDRIFQNKKYLVRLSDASDECGKLKPEYLAPKYILLYDLDAKEECHLFKVHSVGLEAVQDNINLVFDICQDTVEEELRYRNWRVKRIVNEDDTPVLVNYVNLFEPR